MYWSEIFPFLCAGREWLSRYDTIITITQGDAGLDVEIKDGKKIVGKTTCSALSVRFNLSQL